MPPALAMERCYDKYEATRIAAANGLDCPPTAFATDAGGTALPEGVPY
jgi:biotin carboxylase